VNERRNEGTTRVALRRYCFSQSAFMLPRNEFLLLSPLLCISLMLVSASERASEKREAVGEGKHSAESKYPERSLLLLLGAPPYHPHSDDRERKEGRKEEEISGCLREGEKGREKRKLL